MTSPATDEQSTRLQSALGDAYEVRGIIGSGGFASVFAAFDRQLKREVAVKVLRAELEASVFRERFRREAESVAQLRHPHIVPIYAVGEAEGMAWLIMPHVRGESLQQLVEREGRLPIDEATRILRDATNALAVAHRAGILHRDIKPDNIMLDGPERHVLLMDFGIAKALGETGVGVTATGMIVGTPQYMSPEQATGDKSIDHRSDLYSLGVVAFQMIAGTPPFSASSVPMLIMKHIAEPAPSLLEVRRDCPRALADAIAKCLEKDPADRWASAEEFSRALGNQLPAVLAPGLRRISSRVSGAVAESSVPAPIRQFRVAMVVSAFAVGMGMLIDTMLRMPLVAPLIFLIVSIVLASKYGRLWTDGYEFSDLFARESRGSEDARLGALVGVDAHTVTPRSLELRRLGEHGPSVHRARTDRGAIIAILAQLPRSERDRMPDVLTPLDGLLAEATSLAAQLSALDTSTNATVRSPSGRTQPHKAGASSSQTSPRMLEVRTQLEKEREDTRHRIERRLSECFAAIEGIRLAVERIEAEGWSGGEALLREVLDGLAPVRDTRA